MTKAKYYPVVECPECRCHMGLNRHTNAIECVSEHCKSYGITFLAPVVEFELVPAPQFVRRRHAKSRPRYGLWENKKNYWMIEDDGTVCSRPLPVMLLAAHSHSAWDAKIIGDDGLPVDLPED